MFHILICLMLWTFYVLYALISYVHGPPRRRRFPYDVYVNRRGHIQERPNEYQIGNYGYRRPFQRRRQRQFLGWLLILSTFHFSSSSSNPSSSKYSRALILDLNLEEEAILGGKFCGETTDSQSDPHSVLRLDEFFRPDSSTENCRDVISCTSGGAVVGLRCPNPLLFDVQKQVCEWSHKVDNCHQRRRQTQSSPAASSAAANSSIHAICGDSDHFPCKDDSICLPRPQICDEISDCLDGSDREFCGPTGKREDSPPPPDCLSLLPQKCALPRCYCILEPSDIPGGLTRNETPQMIVINFEDSLNLEHREIIEAIFHTRSENDESVRNPNNCSMKGTFFVSHEYTDYGYVNKLWEYGHEIGVHSVTNNPDPHYWTRLNSSSWSLEMGKMKEYLETFAHIKKGSSQIEGSRAPMLRVGGNSYFKALNESQLKYDSSLVVPATNPVPSWPYTLDASLPHPCYGNGIQCPSRSFKGFWEIPINELKTPDDSSRCLFFQLCPNLDTPYALFRALHHNFLRHFRTNRAPYAIHLNPAWFKARPELLDGLIRWIRRIRRKFHNIAYFVSNKQVLQWMQNPTPISQLQNFEPWKENCSKNFEEESQSCPQPKICFIKERRTFRSCLKICPDKYPWI